MKLKQCSDLTSNEKLEMIKEHLGYFFGTVPPIRWNPYEYPGHLAFMLDAICSDKNDKMMFDALLNIEPESITDIMMMPFKDPEKIIDVCGHIWGLWLLKRTKAKA